MTRVSIDKRTIHASAFLNEPIEYGKSFSRGMRIDLGDVSICFISGTASINKSGKSCYSNNFSGQVRRTFANLNALLESEGANWHDVVQTRCYLKSMRRYYRQFNQFRNSFYKQQALRMFPASVCIEANLCRPELLVEIELIAIIKSK